MGRRRVPRSGSSGGASGWSASRAANGDGGQGSSARFQEIVDAAARLFAAQGYAATSVQEIADAVGMLPGSLYHYIHTKEDLLYAVIDEAHGHTAALGVEALSLAGDAREKLRYIVVNHLRGAADQLAKVKVYYAESQLLSSARREEVLARRDSYERAVREVIEQGQREGVFASHLDPVLTAIAVLAVLNSVQQWFKPSGRRSLEEVIAVFSDLLERAVLADGFVSMPWEDGSGTVSGVRDGGGRERGKREELGRS